MRFLAVTALALLLLSIESVLVKTFGFEVTRIDVGLALVVFAALRLSTVEGAFSAFAVGYVLDVFTGRPTGLYPALAMLVFLLVRAASLLVDGRSRVSYLGFTAAATVLISTCEPGKARPIRGGGRSRGCAGSCRLLLGCCDIHGRMLPRELAVD